MIFPFLRLLSRFLRERIFLIPGQQYPGRQGVFINSAEIKIEDNGISEVVFLWLRKYIKTGINFKRYSGEFLIWKNAK